MKNILDNVPINHIQGEITGKYNNRDYVVRRISDDCFYLFIELGITDCIALGCICGSKIEGEYTMCLVPNIITPDPCDYCIYINNTFLCNFVSPLDIVKVPTELFCKSNGIIVQKGNIEGCDKATFNHCNIRDCELYYIAAEKYNKEVRPFSITTTVYNATGSGCIPSYTSTPSKTETRKTKIVHEIILDINSNFNLFPLNTLLYINGREII